MLILTSSSLNFLISIFIICSCFINPSRVLGSEKSLSNNKNVSRIHSRVIQDSKLNISFSGNSNFNNNNKINKRQTFKFPSDHNHNARRPSFLDDADTIIIQNSNEGRQASSRIKLQQQQSNNYNNNNNGSLYFDNDESHNSLDSDIKLIDEMLTIQMRQKKPNINANFHLLPKPNFSFLPDLSPLRQLFQWSSETVRSTTTCYSCKVGFGLFLTKARLKTTLGDVINQAIFACKFFQLSSQEVCAGLVHRFAPTLYYIVTSKRDLTPITFCAMVLQSSGCTTKDPQINWNVLPTELFGHKLPSIIGDFSLSIAAQNTKLRSQQQQTRQVAFHDLQVPSNAKLTKILHLTDIHLDPEYAPGAHTECSNELCCRLDDGAGPPGSQAGYYGDYRGCDLPEHSLENALQHISSTHPDIDLIYMTGDLVSHEVWKTNIERNVQVIKSSTAMIRKYFPNTILIPVLGNHETHPVNLYSTFGKPHPLGTDWVYEATAKAWEGWIPQESLPYFLKAGYFDVKVPGSNLRVIVLNTNLCYTYNFWQIYDGRDPGGQLDWLVQVLLKSESAGEKVHILGHVPPNQNECWFIWSRNFYQIINRFSSIVKAQFYGHTHYDGFHLYYDEQDASKPISPIWIGASLTPFTNLNPGYKLFYADGSLGGGIASLWNILDHETWIYNLTDANLAPNVPPRWFKLYTATAAYDLPNVLPESLDLFIHRMATDLKTFEHYHRNYHTDVEIGIRNENCDTICRKRHLCNIVTPYFTNVDACTRIENEIDGIVLPRSQLQNRRRIS